MHNLIVSIRCILIVAFVFTLTIFPLSAFAEKANVFFIHGANESEQDARAWAVAMFKGLY